jgi:pimeloyl-ACP methyl ester carboxylesterase
VNPQQWDKVFAAFGPRIPSPDALARRTQNAAVGPSGMRLMRQLNLVDQLATVGCPTMVCVGALDPVTPVTAAREIMDGLPRGTGQLEIIDLAGHFPWLDRTDRYWSILTGFLAATTGRDPEPDQMTGQGAST